MPQAINNKSGFNSPKSARHKWRMLSDKLAAQAVRVGGMSVILAITLIFFYLLMVVMPLFESAEIEKLHDYELSTPQDNKALHYIIDEQGRVAMRIGEDGKLVSFKMDTGEVISESQLTNVPITSFAKSELSSGVIALGLNDGSVIALKLSFRVTYETNESGTEKIITPEYEAIFGEGPIVIDEAGNALIHVAIQGNEESYSIVSISADNQLRVTNFLVEESLFEDEMSFEIETYDIEKPNYQVSQVLMDNEQRMLYVADTLGGIYFYNMSDKDDVKLVERVEVAKSGSTVTDIQLAAGSISVLVSESSGRISQWFPVRDDNNQYSLSFVREFSQNKSSVVKITSEYFRKAFVSVNENGDLGLFHLTAHQNVLMENIDSSDSEKTKIKHLVISPRANMVLLEDENAKFSVWHINNEFPEISFNSLWDKVWYEGYSEPDYLWQSSSASNDFEPKFSLVPLSFGTIKAAFYAMLVAMPLAIFGAIYTAYFMSPKLRQTVKPSIEIMEALPTVILGFLAGLWFAPFLELHMPGVFAIFVILPIGVVLFGYLWSRLPHSATAWVPDGWQPILLLPVIILIVWGALAISPMMEIWFFGGNMPIWLNEELGIGYDQRNAMVVGFAMGFAVIPTIFSIAEDAIFSVPKFLTNGSLALGATQWQTLTKVVILTASPGIFSAVMIGFGRAVGETMIVLMATGNTPVMDFSVFEGMRTLSANIAVEMPESEVGSTHYRVLFLAALILFVFTFFFNTIAEVVRQRLRTKYSSL